ncbi:putative zinc finger in n-recognin (UBR box) domain-containing protein [Hirsutella rhossiliensis]|uniref:E3 ubiquitin-protein ligase n=1 Tax=Hirsutella rhossiliensis TaxID=111463 RepID=A0A9P8MLB8_9HYPO|nr:putative zinc finger in n-recognin (UBR box) domain-containing protein [Hirsutella rhossiliensis]KAH0957437.1 putative zinc finger in n-recognin (UBR box) domain-containing protein [Hirsutella rhossiliensis]
MEAPLSTQEQQLRQMLADLPARFNYRYTEEASSELLRSLFWSLAGGKDEYMRLLFPTGKLSDTLRLSDAQGAVEGAEYSEAARGKRCGHIFKPGEASYMCRTCGTDETCCLCSRCFDSTDHTGHMVRIQISVGNSGCCDCGDDEAWRTPLLCTIHSNMHKGANKGKGKETAGLPDDLVANLQMTIGRVFDYICDVISCSPEQLRQAKSKASILKDEEASRLSSKYYGYEAEPCGDFALILWNDEKHTVQEVQDQVARACRKSLRHAARDAWETDAIGRSILTYLPDIDKLLHMAKIMEAIRVTVTIRAARDTFREQMCGTLVEWLSDISGCTVGHDNHILRQTVCEQVMRPWQQGSPAIHTRGLIDDEEEDEQAVDLRTRLHGVNARFILALQAAAGNRADLEVAFGDDDDDDDEDDEDDDEADDDDDDDADDADMDEGDDENRSTTSSTAGRDEDEDEDVMMVDARGDVADLGMNWTQPDQALEEDEATMAGYPPPPPPPPAQARAAAIRDRDGTPSDSDTAEPLIAPAIYAKANVEIPKTPGKTEQVTPRPGRYWIETPAVYTQRENVPPAEDVFQRVRLDWLLLFDLRMWKKVRNDLRSLYISTVVQMPEFKRVLALRFASLYTILAQLYLVGDREPDHSIINLSLQMLTTPSITAEVVERGNFLSSLLAILYTFLTTRQVGHPWDVSPDAVLAVESGSVTNRRMYHFYQDLKYLFGSVHVQERLHQCIGPNVRAVTEHVEYEADSWITASLVTRQINLQARNLAEAFRDCPPDEVHYLQRAIRFTAKTVILNSIGAERHRFKQAEIKDEVKYKKLSDFEFDDNGAEYYVVKFVVEKDSISFHHALHYTLSWLIELMGRPQVLRRDCDPEDYLMAAFDFPLRVCAWLAQIKANMWTAMVVCSPSRVLASIIDRFGMDGWVKGLFELKSEAQDDTQHLDVVEDMIHLLIVLLSDRTSLIAPEDQPNSRILAMRRDITHVLCFKPLSFNEICNKLPEKYQEQEDFHHVLDEMATFKPPEGVSDVGTFELRHEFIEDIDPYIAHYNKNQREESEMAYRKKMAKKTGKMVEEIVYEPKHRPIPSGLFENLGDFTGTGMFAQIVYYSLLYPLVANRFTPSVPFTRLETFLQVVLHLILIAILEDKTDEAGAAAAASGSFVEIALTKLGRSNFMPTASNSKTIVSLLNLMSTKDEFKSVHPKLALVLKRLKQKRPQAFEASFAHLGIAVDRINTASPANNSVEEERERRKKAALSRQAKVMAQFQQQQKSFLENQGAIDWGSDLEDEDDAQQTEDRKHSWKYPTGTCILCQEEADDRRLYGTFALVNESRILRQTNFQDPDHVREASQTPCSLDRSAEDIRPFGIARENRKMVEKLNFQGDVFLAERQTIGKGYTGNLARPGPVASGCGHMMHFRCFEVYYEATNRRHTHQIARHHPEDTKRNEFVCPLCKALGNAFLPIVWKGLEESYPGYLQPQGSFSEFLEKQMASVYCVGGSKARDVEGPGLPEIYTPSMPGSLVENLRNLPISDGSIWTRIAPESHTSALGTPVNSAFSIGGALGSGYPRGVSPPNSEILGDLVAAYRRLRDTVQVNGLLTRHVDDDKADYGDELHSSDALVQVVGFTISSVELQQRGVEAQPGMTLLDKIPEQVLMHLRVLSETASSYMSVGARQPVTDNPIEAEFRKDCERQHCQLFMARYFPSQQPESAQPVDMFPAILTMDPFVFLVECAYGLAAAQKVEISHLVRLCYLAELVKVIHHMNENIPLQMWVEGLKYRKTQDMAMNNFADFALVVTEYGFIAHDARDGADGGEVGDLGFQQPGVDTLEGWYTFVKKYALTFLRKTLVFLYVKYGVDFNSRVSPTPDADELDRLTEALRVPSFDEMCASLTSNSAACGWPDTTRPLVAGWVQHQALWAERSGDMSPTALVSHPGIFELIGLPKTYDTLIEEATRRRCPTTGKDLTDPVICLFCGEVFCSQSTCCQKPDLVSGEANRIGGAQQHMRRCQRNIGVFLNIRKCSTVYLFRQSGSFTAAPYIDKYGETDPQLRHGRQLFLNQKRYDSMVRNTVLNHGVPSLISRKLEAEINNGGWDTL